MPDGALDSRGRRGKLLCNLRIKNLRNRVDHVHIVDRDHDRLTQILIPLHVRGYADLVNHGCNERLNVGLRIARPLCRALRFHDLERPLRDGLQPAGLADKIPHAVLFRRLRGILGHKACQRQTDRRLRQRACCFQNGNPVELRQQQIQNQQICLHGMQQLHGLFAVVCHSGHHKRGVLPGSPIAAR